MALRLRRGTNAERQLITPLEGEPIFTTDTKDLYIGDGSTAGGIKVGGDIPTSINDLTDVNTSGIGVGQVLKWNGSQFVAGDDFNDGTGPVSGGIVEGQVYNISISGNDSSLIVDANKNTLRGIFEGVAYGDLIGSIFSETDSSLILDGPNRFLNINNIAFTNLNPSITATNTITMSASGTIFVNDVQLNAGSQIEPTNNNEGFVGSSVKKFAQGHFTSLYANSIEGNFKGTVVGDDSAILLDGITGEHYGVFNGNVIGGNVLDSSNTLVLDTINKVLYVGDIELTTLNPEISSSNTITISAPGTVFVNDILFNTGSQIEPLIDNEGFIGSFSKRFTEGHFNELYAGSIVGNFQGTLVGDDSTILVDGLTGDHFGLFNGNLIGDVIGNLLGNVEGNVLGSLNGTVLGDLTGSVFADDSTLMIDALSKDIIPNRIYNPTNEFIEFGHAGEGSDNALRITRQSSAGIALSIVTHTDNNNAADIRGIKTRGTIDNQLSIISGDRLLEISAGGYDGTDVRDSSVIQFIADGTVANNFFPGKIRLVVTNTAGTGIKDAYLDSSGTFVINDILKLPVLTSAPASPAEGMIAIADGNTVGWDPKGTNGGVSYPVYYDTSGNWQPMV